MQTTIYYKEEDEYLINKVEQKAERERKSKSAVVLSILEQHFEAEQRLGEILRDLGALSVDQLNQALQLQQEQDQDKKIGEVLVEKDYAREVDIDRALEIQRMTN